MFEGQTVKVVIAALNEESSIESVLSAIAEWIDEVIVVDNGSADRTAQLAQQRDGTGVQAYKSVLADAIYRFGAFPGRAVVIFVQAWDE